MSVSVRRKQLYSKEDTGATQHDWARVYQDNIDDMITRFDRKMVWTTRQACSSEETASVFKSRGWYPTVQNVLFICQEEPKNKTMVKGADEIEMDKSFLSYITYYSEITNLSLL